MRHGIFSFSRKAVLLFFAAAALSGCLKSTDLVRESRLTLEKYDANGDGMLSGAEKVAYYKYVVPMAENEDEAVSMIKKQEELKKKFDKKMIELYFAFKKADADGSGKLSREEFATMSGAAQADFAFYERDGDGSIDLAEYVTKKALPLAEDMAGVGLNAGRYIKETLRKKKATKAVSLRKMDSDRDGWLTRQEAAAAHVVLFRDLPGGKDGAWTFEEYTGWTQMVAIKQDQALPTNAFIRKGFAEKDKNRDGIISAEEYSESQVAALFSAVGGYLNKRVKSSAALDEDSPVRNFDYTKGIPVGR